jgi:hypothetical protein
MLYALSHLILEVGNPPESVVQTAIEIVGGLREELKTGAA